MEESQDKLQSDRLFKGLTRPAMVFGVSFSVAFVNVIFSFLFYVISESLISLFGSLILIHLIGYLICFKEPLFIELFIVRMQKCSVCRNRIYHGANSYDVY